MLLNLYHPASETCKIWKQLGDLGHPQNFNWTSEVFLDYSEAPNLWQPPRAPPLTVLTGVAVEALGAVAAPCEPVTGAIVLAQAVQGAASPILPWQTFCWQDMDRKTDKQWNKQSLTSPREARLWQIALLRDDARRTICRPKNICYEDTGFLHNCDAFTYFGEKSFMLYRCLNSNFLILLTVCLFQIVSSQTRCWTCTMCCKAM